MEKIIFPHKRRKQLQNKQRLIAVGVVVVVAMLALVAWKLFDAYQASNDPNHQAKQAVQEVGRLIVLPKDETPAVVTVVDKSKVNNVPFLERSAENGDKMLVYSKARKVVLYRPSERKIVDVGPVSIAPPPKSEQR